MTIQKYYLGGVIAVVAGIGKGEAGRGNEEAVVALELERERQGKVGRGRERQGEAGERKGEAREDELKRGDKAGPQGRSLMGDGGDARQGRTGGCR
ncbi:hypothetical protein ACLOJK_025650 [Asimina triloba]